MTGTHWVAKTDPLTQPPHTYLENALRSPLSDVVRPPPRAHVKPRQGEEHVHFLETVVALVGYDSSRRIGTSG